MAFYGQGWVSVHLDARRAGVRVPEDFAGDRHLVLQYGRDMPIPIPDLEIGDDGISATLSFSRIPQQTHIPWSAVYIVSCDDGRRFLYYEDFPEDLLPDAHPRAGALAASDVSGELEAESTTDNADPRETKRRPSFLKSVPAETEAENDDAAEEEPRANGENEARKRPQLKVVK